MQIRTLSALVLGSINDPLLKISYLKILTNTTFETVKLPTSLENYKYGYLIEPNVLLNLEIVKTRKNWIVRHILSHQKLFELTKYQDFVKLTDIYKIVESFLHEGQEVDLLAFLEDYFAKNTLNQIDLAEFELQVLHQLGFANKLNKNKSSLVNLSSSKAENNLNNR